MLSDLLLLYTYMQICLFNSLFEFNALKYEEERERERERKIMKERLVRDCILCEQENLSAFQFRIRCRHGKALGSEGGEVIGAGLSYVRTEAQISSKYYL
jgi:hypothetical protein